MAGIEELRDRLAGKSDEELVEILRARDTQEWRPEVFTLAEAILRRRGIEPPPVTLAKHVSAEGSTELVAVAGFRTVVEADPCRTALLAAGFRVVARDEFLLQIDQSLGPAYGGIILAVPAEQAEDARAYLRAAERGELRGGEE